MIRWRTLALCLPMLLPLSAGAATIAVNTPYDIEADDDALCSIREAITASEIASKLTQRSAGRTSMVTSRTALEDGLKTILEDEINNTFPRAQMLVYVQTMLDELVRFDYAPADPTLLTELQAFHREIQALGNSQGPFDLQLEGELPAYPVGPDDDNDEPTDPEPGYYIYEDSDGSGETSVTIDSPLNVGGSGNPITYNLGDRAYWNGSNWRKYTASQNIPADAGRDEVERAIDIHERGEVLETAAIDELEARAEVDGCDDGTSFDVVLLEQNTTYYLNAPLDVRVRLTFRGEDGVVIKRCTDAADCPGKTVSPHRLIELREGVSLEMNRLTLRDGDAGDGDGGAILARGTLSLDRVVLENNRAARGGAIFGVDGVALVVTDSTFRDNQATGAVIPVVKSGDGGAIYMADGSMEANGTVFGGYVANASPLTGYRLAGNTAAGDGGAIMIAEEATGSALFSGGAFLGNTATRGSALSITTDLAAVSMENITIARNHATSAAALDLRLPSAGGGLFELNNVTMIENVADAGTAGIFPSLIQRVTIFNSVIAGNIDTSGGPRPDCDFSVGYLDAGHFRRNYYGAPPAVSPLLNGCPGARYPSTVPETENYELGGGLVLIDPVNGLLKDLDPGVGPFFVPVFPDDVNDSTENRLVNRGAGSLEANRCATEDQRGLERSSSVDEECDIGAVEYQIGRRKDDVVEMLVDERRCLDVISNDLGDTIYIPGSLRVFSVERPGTQAIVVSRNPGVGTSDPVLNLDDPTVCSNHADLIHDEAILLIPARGFHGETNIIYGADWQTAGAVPVTGSFSGVARVQTESRGGITASSLGSLPAPLLLLWAGVLALRRRRVRAALLTMLLAAFLPARAAAENIIYVNSSLDEPVTTTPGDGACTLREALDVARNDRANSSGGDCRNGNEGPDVIEFAPGTTEVILQDTVLAYGNVTIRCPEPAAAQEGQPPPVAQVCRIHRLAANPKQFRLIDSRGTLRIDRMVFEGGQAPDRGAGQNGGAISSTGSLTINGSRFLNNSAVDGGALFLSGATSALQISTSVFEGNSSRAGTVIDGSGTVVGMTAARTLRCPQLARGGQPGMVGSRLGGGGAIATTQSDAHKIAIQSSTFINNCSVAGAAAADLNTRGSAVVVNSTFSGNSSLEGPGAVDVSGTQGNAFLRNITVLANLSGASQIHETWEDPSSPLPTQRSALLFGVISATLASSVIGGNFAESAPTVAANCPASGGLRSFNLYGDEDDPFVATATPGRGYTCVVDPSSNDRLLTAAEVYNPLSPAAGLLSALEDQDVGYVTLPMHEINDPPTLAVGLLVDAGYNLGLTTLDNMVDPLQASTDKCATVDARGASRTSGGRCDIGAYEVLGVTAVEDEGSNQGRRDRRVLVDLITNDIFDDISANPARAIKQDCDTTLVIPDAPAVGATTYRFVGDDTDVDADTAQDVCAEVIVPASEMTPQVSVRFLQKDVPADAAIMGTRLPASEYVMMFENGGVLRDKDRVGGRVELTYRVYTVNQVVSNAAPLQLSVLNVPPQIVSDRVVAGRGEVVEINVLANDDDPDDSATLALVSITGAQCSEVRQTEIVILYWQCQFGRVYINPPGSPGVIRFVPTNSFNPFTQELTYEVSDQDPGFKAARSNKATLTIVTDHQDVSGGSILGDDDLSDMLGLDFLGAPGSVFFLSLGLATLRRRRR